MLLPAISNDTCSKNVLRTRPRLLFAHNLTLVANTGSAKLAAEIFQAVLQMGLAGAMVPDKDIILDGGVGDGGGGGDRGKVWYKHSVVVGGARGSFSWWPVR